MTIHDLTPAYRDYLVSDRVYPTIYGLLVFNWQRNSRRKATTQ